MSTEAILLGAVIAARRKQRGLSQMDLARAVGDPRLERSPGRVTQATISRMEGGTAVPDIFVLRAVAHVLKVSVSELLEDLDDATVRAKAFAKANEVTINRTVARLVVEQGS
jgi:transcriptional regulator with XRE-family HTH domain